MHFFVLKSFKGHMFSSFKNMRTIVFEDKLKMIYSLVAVLPFS
jgi:hypothetical protein